MDTDLGFKVAILASGSSGNATLIETPKKKILVDAGLTGKKMEELLGEVGRRGEDLDAILVTHEHSDHIHGVGVLARRYNLDVYANEGTWNAMDKKLGKIPVEQKHIFEMGKTLTFGDIDVESFGVSHDAAEPQFYSFQKDGKSFVILTDTGYVSERMRGVIKNADCYLMESNHDVEMLRSGAYPWSLKQRILSDKGHLSNDDGALVMTDILGDNTKKIFLGHLSRENNIKELAHMTMEETLMQHDLGVNEQFRVFDTSPDHSTELFAV
jgi:phosphoribosyl 1,2-cyclic phosphodiesterase